MCKGVGATLTRIVQRWYLALASRSVRSFLELVTKFVHHFSNSKMKEKDETNLYDLRKNRHKTVRAYIKKFKKVKISITDCRDANAIKVFIIGFDLFCGARV